MDNKTKQVNRRSFLKTSLFAASAATTLSASSSKVFAKPDTKSKKAAVPLREKFYGCIAGCHIGSAMGAAVEGSPWEELEAKYGTLDKLLPYQHYDKKVFKWMREPGTTEDGVERQKLMITAIIEKQDRINAEDLRKAWVEHMNPNAAGIISEPFEGTLLALARTPVPAVDIGKYCGYEGLITLARACHPIGLINAGNIDDAINDIREVGQIYHNSNSSAIQWAEVTVVGLAAATKPDATVDSVLGAVFDNCDKADKRFTKKCGILTELDRALKLTRNCNDFRQMREKFDSVYMCDGGVPYAFSYANEIVTRAICVFKMTRGNTWETMKAAVNLGRDTDCCAAVSTGLSGALTGAGSIPKDLIRQVDYATSINPHTNTQRTMRQTSDGLYNAFKARLRKLKAYTKEMDAV
ncbi:MAG: ADP-ribosylglycohydrolase family protein [Planctomycetota bacterium]|jgi:ADP-ribosylglycohydrolase